MRYYSSNIHQLPKGSIVLTINERKVTCDNDISNAFLSDEETMLKIKLPNCPPYIPDLSSSNSKAIKKKRE